MTDDRDIEYIASLINEDQYGQTMIGPVPTTNFAQSGGPALAYDSLPARFQPPARKHCTEMGLCKATDCKHNRDGLCSLTVISVGPGGGCAQYAIDLEDHESDQSRYVELDIDPDEQFEVAHQDDIQPYIPLANRSWSVDPGHSRA